MDNTESKACNVCIFSTFILWKIQWKPKLKACYSKLHSEELCNCKNIKTTEILTRHRQSSLQPKGKTLKTNQSLTTLSTSALPPPLPVCSPPLTLPLPSCSPPLTHPFPSLPLILFHCGYQHSVLQFESILALWNDWFGHIIINKCEQFWVVVCKR